jgi:hypothetical protein
MINPAVLISVYLQVNRDGLRSIPANRVPPAEKKQHRTDHGKKNYIAPGLWFGLIFF